MLCAPGGHGRAGCQVTFKRVYHDFRMRSDVSTSSGSVALPPQAGQPPALDRVGALVERIRGAAPSRLGSRAGFLALAMLLAGVSVVVVFSTAGDSVLVPRSPAAFPAWEAGPLHLLFAHLSLPASTMTLGYSGLLVLMTLAYAIVLLAARSLSLRTITALLTALSLILLMGPPLQLNDVWNYLGYARLGALHGLNPYTHVISAESYDPIFRFTTWWNLSSPYGPLFTVMSYPLAWLPLPVAYWVLKTAVVAASLGFLWCVYKCAVLLGRDPRLVLLFVGANPIYLFYGVGSFHNDFFMLLPSTAAIALLLTRRDRASGAMLALAVAIKVSNVVLLPFLLIAVRPPERRLRVLTGVVVTVVVLVAVSVAMFGLSLPNVATQSGVVTAYSIPNLVGLLLGLGGSTVGLIRVANGLVVVVVLLGLRRRDWISAAGWATMALIASLAWLMPWYVIWVLPLAALGSSRRLRRGALVLTVFLVLTFIPEWNDFLSAHGINPMSTPTGQAAYSYEQHLQRGP
jgi:alpha-1,6-mannosyltransferase